MREINAQDAIHLLRAAMELKPLGEEHVYPHHQGTCRNVEQCGDEWISSCIVGSVVVDVLGIDAELLADYGLMLADAHELAREIRAEGIYFTPRATMVLFCVQREQDSGGTWGQAIRTAETILQNGAYDHRTDSF